MDLIRESIIKLLDELPDNKELVSTLSGLGKKHGKETFSKLIHVLTHLELEPDKAEECWYQIVKHREKLSAILEREINLRTAICDYFCSIDVSFRNPKIVEISVFENKDKASKLDKLTNLYNRGYFDESLKRELARAKRYNLELSVLFFDLDDFKQVNDKYGHLAGDVVLKSVAQILTREVRAEDIPARYGGEELVVILPQTEKIRSLILGERIREEIERVEYRFQNETTHVTVSGGLASFPIDAETPADLVRYADQALYEAKSYGKNNIVIYSKSKRRYLRFDFVSEVEVLNANAKGSARQFTVSSRNFSKTGIMFESAIPLELGDLVRMSIPLEKNEENIIVSGNVVRVEFIRPDCFEIGVSFVKIDKAISVEISKYMIKYFEKINLQV